MKIPYSELRNPLFIYPSDGPGSLSSPEKLTGSKNHHSWCKSLEIRLSTKRKLVFVQGTLPRASYDVIKVEQWDAYNNLAIVWIMNCVSDSIARSMLYRQSADEIFLQLKNDST